MKELKCNMLDEPCDVIIVTTNGFVKANGEAVMGRGIAKQISDIFPSIKRELGTLIKTKGNKVHILGTKNNITLISFPVKPDYVINNGSNVVKHCTASINERVPGFLAKADVNIIEQSLIELSQLLKDNPQWKKILIPRVGCGAGELNYEDIKPLMEKYLTEDRVFCCSY